MKVCSCILFYTNGCYKFAGIISCYFLDKLFQNFCSYTLKTSQCNNVTNFPFYACNVTLVSTILRQQFFTHYFM